MFATVLTTAAIFLFALITIVLLSQPTDSNLKPPDPHPAAPDTPPPPSHHNKPRMPNHAVQPPHPHHADIFEDDHDWPDYDYDLWAPNDHPDIDDFWPIDNIDDMWEPDGYYDDFFDDDDDEHEYSDDENWPTEHPDHPNSIENPVPSHPPSDHGWPPNEPRQTWSTHSPGRFELRSDPSETHHHTDHENDHHHIPPHRPRRSASAPPPRRTRQHYQFDEDLDYRNSMSDSESQPSFVSRHPRRPVVFGLEHFAIPDLDAVGIADIQLSDGSHFEWYW